MTGIVRDLFVELSGSAALGLVIKATLALAMGFIAARLARRAPASVRHVVLASTFGALFALPLAAALAPIVALDIPVSVPIAPAVAPPAPPPSLGATSVPAPQGQRIAVSPAAAGGRWVMPSAQTVGSTWGIGAALFFASFASGLWRLRRVRRCGVPWLDADAPLRAIAGEAGLRRPIEVLLHDGLMAPVTYGLRRPAILLPTDATEWSTLDVRRAFVHELEHVRRGDWVVHILARAVCAVYWFHPLVWVAWRQLCLEAERACDDAVLSGAERTDYAEQLVGLARRLSDARMPPVLSMANRSDLASRVSSILDSGRRRGRAGLLTASASVFVAAIVVLAMAPVRAVATPVRTAASATPVDQPTQEAAPRSLSDAEWQAFIRKTQDSLRVLAEETRGRVNQEDFEKLLKPLDAETRDDLRSLTRAARTASQSQPRTIAPRLFSRIDVALLEASQEGDIEDMTRLLSAGANVNAEIAGDGSPLIVAARRGHMEAIRFLLDRGANPNVGVSGDGNPLIMAARGGHLDAVKLLLDRGADANLGVPGDGNALIMAARAGHEAVVTLLLARGAIIDQIVPGDENALIQASGAGHLRMVQLLVARGADVNARVWVEQVYGRTGRRSEGEWRTPLNMAQRNGHDAVVAYLRSAGARESTPAVALPADRTERQYTGKPVSFDFQDVDVRTVLRVFAQETGLNIVIGPTVMGTVNVSLHDVPWDQALDMILRANKLRSVIDGNIVRIVLM